LSVTQVKLKKSFPERLRSLGLDEHGSRIAVPTRILRSDSKIPKWRGWLMKIYILGIDHEIQLADGRRAQAEKAEFAKLLTEIFSKHEIRFIGEETFPEKASIARTFGGMIGIPWEPIEMSPEGRKELGIADEQVHERHEPIFENNLVVGSKARRVLSDYIREEYMVWRMLTKVEDPASVLVLCGLMHAENLGRLFQREGHEVTVDSLCNYAWYSHPTGCPEANG